MGCIPSPRGEIARLSRRRWEGRGEGLADGEGNCSVVLGAYD